MVKKTIIVASLQLLLLATSAYADDRIELQTTTIKGNKELPKILYVVPWKDVKQSKKAERKLELHSLFGNLFEPVIPILNTKN